MFDSLISALDGRFFASFLVLLIGAVVAVAAGILLHTFVFGPKAKDPNAGKMADFANGKHFMPLAVLKAAYYSIAIYLLFIGTTQIITSGYSGINGFIQYVFIGNIVLRAGYECVLAVRKSAGIDTDNGTAEEPKVYKPLIQPQPQYQQPMYQQPQYQQPQYQQPQYQQPAPAPVPQPAPVPVQQSVPVPQPVPAPAPVQQSAPDPQAVQSVCPNCGNAVKPGAKFCPKCGGQIN